VKKLTNQLWRNFEVSAKVDGIVPGECLRCREKNCILFQRWVLWTGCEEFQAKLGQLRRVDVMYWTLFRVKEAVLLCPRKKGML